MKYIFASLLAIALAACSRTPIEKVDYTHFLEPLTHVTSLARLDGESTQFISSSDLTGNNEDYNHFQGTTRDGELILADLKGPGVVSRFWFTGIETNRFIRFYFDGERTPRLDFTWHDLTQGVSPFDIEPLSVDEQNCWHTYVPIPFERRLLITTEDAGYQYGEWPKMYYQINWHPLPRGQTVRSFQNDHENALRRVAQKWSDNAFTTLPTPTASIEVPAEGRVALWETTGAGHIAAFVLEPLWEAAASAMQRDRLLREVWLKLYWDEHPEASVSVPLGDFFGSVWNRWRGQSMLFGSIDNVFYSRFPMPFQSAARIELVNKSTHAFDIKVGVESGPPLDERHGYFHAGWRSSGADDGNPHVVLETQGRGRYVGCHLAVVSRDRNFWVLESDERMYRDGEDKPFWDGTGLEDYFNGGWYYQNVFYRPLHGLQNKSTFRTVQYRMHVPDPVLFDKSFLIDFERGPRQSSRADYESVSYYYLDRPQAADTPSTQAVHRQRPVDEFEPATIMTDLWNFERIGDIQGHQDYIERYLEEHPPPFKTLLRLRHLAGALDHGTLSREAFLDQLAPYLESEDDVLRAQAAHWQQLHADSNKVLVSLYVNMPAELFINGRQVARVRQVDHPVFAVTALPSGQHVVAVAAAWRPYPVWTQVSIRNAEGWIAGTNMDWRHQVNPRGNWMAPTYDDSDWPRVGPFNGRVKGPPGEYQVWVQPDAFPNTISRTYALRPSVSWPDQQGYVVYRQTIEIP